MKIGDSNRSSALSIGEISKETHFGIVSIKPDEVLDFHKSFVENVAIKGYENRMQYGHPILHNPCIEITQDDLDNPEIKSKIDFLINEVMFPIVKDGGGLAANQIAVKSRIFVMHNSGARDTFDMYKEMIRKSMDAGIFNTSKDINYFIENNYLFNTKTPKYFINPKIVDIEDDCTLQWTEGCYSLPGYTIPMQRPAAVTVKYIDIDGKHSILKFFGWLAECAVHETAHLDGELMIDKIPEYKLSRYVHKYRI